jgi:vitamin B12 transporter
MSLSSFLRRACVPAVLSCLLAQAQAQVSLPSAPQTVTVTATRIPTPISDVVADITVLDREAIERAGGRTLVELLSQQAGLQFSSNGGLGKTSSLFIRGLEGRHTLLLVDGVRVYSATVGTPSFDNLPLEAIERIEIVRGPMSALYGSGAVGGVIQVFTRTAAPGLSGNAKAVLGSHGYAQAGGGIAFGDSTFNAAAQVQHIDDRGVSATNPKVPFGSYNPDRDGFRQTGGSLRLGWQPLAGWSVTALALQAHGVTGVDDGPGADAQAGLENRVASLVVRGQVLPAWTTRVSVGQSVDAYDTLSSASPYTTLGAIESQVRQFGWENSVVTPVGTALLLLDRQQETVSRPGAPFTVRDRHIDGLALALNGAAAGHVWQGSLRRDRNSQFGGKTTGALGYGYNVLPTLRLGGSVAQSYVAPSFNQLYYPGFGSPTLLPEEGRHAELNGRWTLGEHAIKLAAFRNRYIGYITSGPAPVNLPLARINGVTLAYEGQWRDVALTASYDHVDPRNATAGNANNGKLLQRRAQDAGRLGADWAAGAYSAGATLAAFSHRYDDTANATRLGGYATLDLRAEVALSRQLKLGVKLNNLADQRYETALGYNQPGREAFVSLRYVTQ